MGEQEWAGGEQPQGYGDQAGMGGTGQESPPMQIPYPQGMPTQPAYGTNPYPQTAFVPPSHTGGTAHCLVLGVIALVMVVACLLLSAGGPVMTLTTAFAAIGTGIAAVVSGIIRVRRKGDPSAPPPGMAVAGLVMGAVAVASIILIVVSSVMLAQAMMGETDAVISGVTPSSSTGAGGSGTVLGTERYDVTFQVNFDQDYEEGGSRVPVRITGTDADGNNVDMQVFMARHGVDVALPEGEYEAEVLGSPISADGVVYAVPQSPIRFQVDDSTAYGDECLVSPPFCFEGIASDDLTDDQAQDALDWARRDTEDPADVDALEKAVAEYRKS